MGQDHLKILFIDIETKASVISTWGIWNINAGLNQIISRGKMICWSAKWKDSPEIIFDSDWTSTHKQMVKHIWNLLDEADAVVHYNGQAFDCKEINRSFLLLGMPPPSPYKQIDLLRVIKRNFRFISNKLDNVAQELGIGSKIKHSGMDLWNDVEKKNPEARMLMQEYNEQDTLLLEKLYTKLEAWLGGYINHNEYSEVNVCPTCGSSHINKRGFKKTNTQVFQQYRCMSCGSWARSNKGIKEKRKSESIVSIR